MIENYIKNFSKVLANTIISDKDGNEIIHETAFKQLIKKILELKNNGSTIYLIGNGGSSGVVSHSSVDFINACGIKANPLTDHSLLTCLSNDYGYENVFSKALEPLFFSNDILIAVSSSGSSKNIVNAVKYANDKNGYVITYSGFKKDNILRSSGDMNFWLDSSDYGTCEIGHGLLLHMLTDELIKYK